MNRMPLSSEIRALAALLAIAAPLLGCDPDGAGANGEDGPEATTVEVFRVEPKLLRDVEIFGGQLAAEHSVMLKPERDGVITEILFDEGQRVEQGAVLFRLRDDEEKARLAEAEAQLALAREVEKRTRSLVTRNAASEAQRDEAVAELAVAKARVELAKVELARTEIRAPFDGVVGMRLVSLGDRVSTGGMRGAAESSLVQIDAIDRLEMTMAVSEHGMLFGRVGAPVELSVLPYPGEKFHGEIFFVSPTLEPSTRRVYMKAWVPNEDGKLRAGLFADVELEVGRRENALVVPESAITYDREGAYVWRVVEGDVAERVPVELGLRRRGVVEVTLGLRAGDTIVSAGTHKVSEGDKIAVASPVTSGHAQRETPADVAAGEGT